MLRKKFFGIFRLTVNWISILHKLKFLQHIHLQANNIEMHLGQVGRRTVSGQKGHKKDSGSQGNDELVGYDAFGNRSKDLKSFFSSLGPFFNNAIYDFLPLKTIWQSCILQPSKAIMCFFALLTVSYIVFVWIKFLSSYAPTVIYLV